MCGVLKMVSLIALSAAMAGCAVESDDEGQQGVDRGDDLTEEARQDLTHRTATVYLENRTGTSFKFQILHQYTGDDTESTGYIHFSPGESKYMLNVNYRTGFLTTGVDNWIVNGIEEKEVVTTVPRLSLGPLVIEGPIQIRTYVEWKKWKSGHGFGAEWKAHTLRASDGGQVTTIVVFSSLVEFRSPSGTSSTYFVHEYDIVPHV